MRSRRSRVAIKPSGWHAYVAYGISDDGAIVVASSTGLALLVPEALGVNVPVGGSIAANDPVAVGGVLQASASFTDGDTADTHTATWGWGDSSAAGAGTVSESNGEGTVTGSHVYAAAGIYPLTLTITDDTGRSVQVTRDVVVYDPSAGFVTGGGWIQSPPGAYKPNELLAGRATFGFVSKYQKGAKVPSGKTEFQFQTANLNFHSDTYDWLVVSGARAQYKGVGTINGTGEYKFILTAIDGNRLTAGQPDRFRIKLWYYDATLEQDVVVYDNRSAFTRCSD